MHSSLCLRTLRRRRLKHAVFGLEPKTDAAEPVAGNELAPALHALDAMPKPNTALAQKQLGAQLLTAMHKLPAMQRAALALRYGQDMSVSEIAIMLGVSEATTKTHLVRGLERLRTLLCDHDLANLLATGVLV